MECSFPFDLLDLRAVVRCLGEKRVFRRKSAKEPLQQAVRDFIQ